MKDDRHSQGREDVAQTILSVLEYNKTVWVLRVQSGSYLSTGWFTLILAMDACYGIHVYGMINDTYCKSEGFRKVPYHYYEPGRDECEEYFLHENAPYGGHRFITEKKVFAKWAKKHTIIFTHPNWTVS
ncbi:PREDICTED: alpha-N-acetylgalactosaminide alpha-2,6-sialyltransferase 3-like [Eurypyga helias]|uniref:alpha-N-acetylgalactosaminide alpha-2,6-sialyltransferase 3-like n=1 Tax=Eurypyga helias TaxID=54383 RepID=UPI00052856FD|nr:PREDICTED: alpha-N-acetylgalactosaminide alpha-2,6-sialyltransferase 3-like [Eurypyga helias]